MLEHVYSGTGIHRETSDLHVTCFPTSPRLLPPGFGLVYYRPTEDVQAPLDLTRDGALPVVPRA